MKTTVKMQGDKMHVVYSGDAQAVIDACAAAAREDRERRDMKSHPKHRLMSMPRELLYKIAIENGIPFNDTESIWKIAMGRDYSRLRTLDKASNYRQSRRRPIVSLGKK